jgi:hypothetical protein
MKIQTEIIIAQREYKLSLKPGTGWEKKRSTSEETVHMLPINSQVNSSLLMLLSMLDGTDT